MDGEFKNFQSGDETELEILTKYRDVLNKETTYSLIASHGRIDDMLYFAQIVGACCLFACCCCCLCFLVFVSKSCLRLSSAVVWRFAFVFICCLLCVGEYNRVISYYIQNSDYQKALQVMKQQTDPTVFYDYSATLMAAVPYETVNTWITYVCLSVCTVLGAVL